VTRLREKFVLVREHETNSLQSVFWLLTDPGHDGFSSGDVDKCVPCLVFLDYEDVVDRPSPRHNPQQISDFPLAAFMRGEPC